MCAFEVTLNKIQVILWNIEYHCRILQPGIPKTSCLLRCEVEFELLWFSIFYLIKSIFFSENCCELHLKYLCWLKKTLPISALSNLTPIQNSNLCSPQHVCFLSLNFDNFEAANNQRFMESIQLHLSVQGTSSRISFL